MVRGNKKSIVKKINVFTSQLCQPCNAKYIVVAVSRGMTSKVEQLSSLREAKKAF